MVPDGAKVREMAARARARRDECEKIAKYARSKGLDVTWERVNRNLSLWQRWYLGAIATGYLIRLTGIRRVFPGQRNT